MPLQSFKEMLIVKNLVQIGNKRHRTQIRLENNAFFRIV